MFNRIPPVTRNLLIANVIVFLGEMLIGAYNDGVFFQWAALYPIQSGNFKIWQLITSMFMHGGISHIAFNMFGLVSFGGILERTWGPKRFFQFYMICGIVAGLTHLLLSQGVAVGASGAIMGLFAAYAYLYPNTELFLIFLPIPIKAKYLIPGLIAIDLFSGIANVQDNVAHFAHLGGAFAGLALVYIWKRTDRRSY